MQGLKICDRVVQPRSVQTAVEQKSVIAIFQSVADGKHRIRIVLFHGEDLGIFRHIAQRIKIPQNPVRCQSQPLQMGKATVSGNQQIVRTDRLYEPGKFSRVYDHTSSHHSTPPFVFVILTHRDKKYNAGKSLVENFRKNGTIERIRKGESQYA